VTAPHGVQSFSRTTSYTISASLRQGRPESSLSGSCKPGPRSSQPGGVRHCQSKFYTACSRPRAGWSSTVFAHELPPRLAGLHAENRLYLFALTVPFGKLDAQALLAGGCEAAFGREKETGQEVSRRCRR
jgi:hypothetical protein